MGMVGAIQYGEKAAATVLRIVGNVAEMVASMKERTVGTVLRM